MVENTNINLKFGNTFVDKDGIPKVICSFEIWPRDMQMVYAQDEELEIRLRQIFAQIEYCLRNAVETEGTLKVRETSYNKRNFVYQNRVETL